jgi:hypothetical protein
MQPEQYRDALTQKLITQRTTMLDDERFYEGKQAMAFLDPEVVRQSDGRLRPVNVNLGRLAIETLAARIKVTGFRSSPGQVVDDMLMREWQIQGLDELSALAQLDCLIFGRSYYLVWGDAKGAPIVTAESPLQMTVSRDPITRRPNAALKRWMDDEGYLHALVLTADSVTEWATRQKQPADVLVGTIDVPFITDQFTRVREDSNPLGVVPVVPLVNRARLDNLDGESELADLKGLLQAIGKTNSDMMVASEYAASPRRWVTGLAPANANAEQMRDIEDRVRQQWEKAYAAKFLIASTPDARMGSFDSAELNNYTNALQFLIGEVASLAGLPAYYVNHNAANPTSADAIRTSESRLTSRAKQRQEWWSGPYEDLMRLVILVRNGQPDPSLDDLETVWMNPEPTTLAQTADAESKLIGAGIVDRRSALEALGYSPLDVERILESEVLA